MLKLKKKSITKNNSKEKIAIKRMEIKFIKIKEKKLEDG
jgi:hypothetical protein